MFNDFAISIFSCRRYRALSFVVLLHTVFFILMNGTVVCGPLQAPLTHAGFFCSKVYTLTLVSLDFLLSLLSYLLSIHAYIHIRLLTKLTGAT